MTKTTAKSKSQSLSAPRSSPPRTRSKTLPESSDPSPRTHPKPPPESNPSPRTYPKAIPKRNFSPLPRTPFSVGAITPIGTRKDVTLSDWWLTRKGKEKKKASLCITGFESSKNGSEMRLFSSGPIVKRHNSTTLEAVDGITISISGFINRSRSVQNGISNEVCNRFLLGFPYNYDEEEEEEEMKDDDFSVSFDDIPVNRLHDLSLVKGCLKNKILDDVVGSLRDLVCSESDKRCERSVVVVADDDESLVSRVVVGVKTRAMRRREEEYESSIGKRAKTVSKKRREGKRS